MPTARAISVDSVGDREPILSVDATEVTLTISDIAFGSTVSIRGPERDEFTVTDDTIVLALSRPGVYRVHVSEPASQTRHEWMITVR